MHVGYLIQRSARYFRRRTALIMGDMRLTFEEVDGRATRLANGLHDLGIRKGARVAILLDNCKEFVEADFGVSKGGFVKLLISPRYTPEEIHFVLEDSGAECAVFGQEFEGTIDSIRGNLPSLKHLVRVGEERGDFLPYEALLARASPEEPESEVAEDDLYEVKYTSGTTGRQKGAMFTHRAKIANVVNILIDRVPISPEDKMLHVGSLAYASGFYMVPHYLRGAANVLLKKFDPDKIFETIESQRITTLSIVPTMLYMMLAHPRVRLYNYSSLKAIYYGGAPMSTEKLKEGIAVFGNVFYQTYGLVEAPMSAHLPISEHKVDGSEEELKRMGSVGREVTNAEIKIVDELGKEVKSGAVGQLIIRAPHAMAGYWNRPAETARTLFDGWLCTGDIGKRDEEGYIYLLDRMHDRIKTGGFNVYPREVEDVLYRHPSVTEAAVIGVPDEKWGERVEAFVVLRPGACLTEEEMIGFCGEQLSGFKKPRSVSFLKELPKNSSGKIMRRTLKEEHWKALDKMIY